MHDERPGHADVTEGSGGIWERRVLGVVLGTIGKGKLDKAFRNSIKAIEARNDGASAAEGT